MGWLDASDLASVVGSVPRLAALPVQEWPRYALSAVGVGAFAGGRASQFELLDQSADEVRFDVDGMSNRHLSPERPMSFAVVSNRWARHARGGGHIVRLNNAIYIELLEPIGGFVESAVFYPAPGPLTLAPPL